MSAVVDNGKFTATAGGWGWFLGDDGSGVWLGREVLRAVLADLDGLGPATMLTARVATELGVSPEELTPQRSHRRGLRRRPGARRGPVCTLRRVGTWRRRRNGPSGPGRDCARGVHPRDADSSRTRCADRVGRVSCM